MCLLQDNVVVVMTVQRAMLPICSNVPTPTAVSEHRTSVTVLTSVEIGTTNEIAVSGISAYLILAIINVFSHRDLYT